MAELSVGAIKSRALQLLTSSGFGHVAVVGITYQGVDANGAAVYSVRYNGYDPSRSSPSSGSTTITVNGTNVSLGGTVSRGTSSNLGATATERNRIEGVRSTTQGNDVSQISIEDALADLENLFFSANDPRDVTDAEIFKSVDSIWKTLEGLGVPAVERGTLIDDILSRASGAAEQASGGLISIGGIQIRHKAGGTGEQWVWDIPSDEFGNTGFIFTNGALEGSEAPPLPVLKGSGGGSGGGSTDDFIFMEPFHVGTYVRPDEGLVEDLIRTKMKVILGAADENRVKMLRQVYMNAHKKQWAQQQAIERDEFLARQDSTLMEATLKGVPVVGRDSLHEHLEEVQIEDPMQSVKEMIRTFDDYKVLHRARPVDTDEEDWIVAAIRNQRNVGLEGNVAVERGQQLASMGDIVADPSEFMGQRTMGTQMPTFFKQLDQSIETIARLAR